MCPGTESQSQHSAYEKIVHIQRSLSTNQKQSLFKVPRILSYNTNILPNIYLSLKVCTTFVLFSAILWRQRLFVRLRRQKWYTQSNVITMMKYNEIKLYKFLLSLSILKGYKSFLCSWLQILTLNITSRPPFSNKYNKTQQITAHILWQGKNMIFLSEYELFFNINVI
jgi:hypothetical protein